MFDRHADDLVGPAAQPVFHGDAGAVGAHRALEFIACPAGAHRQPVPVLGKRRRPTGLARRRREAPKLIVPHHRLLREREGGFNEPGVLTHLHLQPAAGRRSHHEAVPGQRRTLEGLAMDHSALADALEFGQRHQPQRQLLDDQALLRHVLRPVLAQRRVDRRQHVGAVGPHQIIHDEQVPVALVEVGHHHVADARLRRAEEDLETGQAPALLHHGHLRIARVRGQKRTSAVRDAGPALRGAPPHYPAVDAHSEEVVPARGCLCAQPRFEPQARHRAGGRGHGRKLDIDHARLSLDGQRDGLVRAPQAVPLDRGRKRRRLILGNRRRGHHHDKHSGCRSQHRHPPLAQAGLRSGARPPLARPTAHSHSHRSSRRTTARLRLLRPFNPSGLGPRRAPPGPAHPRSQAPRPPPSASW